MRSPTASFHAARELLEQEGILGGSSTGTLLAAALRYCRAQTTPKKVLVFVCDTGNKYLSKLYNDYWMLDNGFLERQPHGDLRDLILRPYSRRDTVVLAPTDLLVTAYQRMKLYEISQLPVMDGDRIVGILDESDVLIHVYGDEARFRIRCRRRWSASSISWTSARRWSRCCRSSTAGTWRSWSRRTSSSA